MQENPAKKDQEKIKPLVLNQEIRGRRFPNRSSIKSLRGCCSWHRHSLSRTQCFPPESSDLGRRCLLQFRHHSSQRHCQGQESRHLWPPWCLHGRLFSAACAQLQEAN